MVNSENILKPTATKRLFVIGGVLLVVGVIGILLYAFQGTNTPVEGNAPADGLWQALIIIGAALFTGVGLVLIIIGLIKRRRIPRGRNDT